MCYHSRGASFYCLWAPEVWQEGYWTTNWDQFVVDTKIQTITTYQESKNKTELCPDESRKLHPSLCKGYG